MTIARSRWIVAVLLAATVPVHAAENKRVKLQLVTGAEISGEILHFDEASGLTLKRDDNGGRLPLRWHQIRNEDIEAVKRLYGYIGDDLPPIQVEALQVRTATGIIIGLDGGREEGKLLLVKRGNVTPVPLESIVSVSPVMVDALEIDNPANVFERKKAEAPPQRAVDYYNLGLVAESLTLFDQARTQFQRALELDPNFSKKGVIDAKMKLLDAKEKEAEETAQLQTIRSLRYRGAFKPALESALDFESKYPSSVQLKDVQREKKLILAAQRDEIMTTIRVDFFSFLRRLAEEKGRDPEVELADGMNWAKSQAYEDVQLKLAALYGITEDQVDELWAARGSSGSPVVMSYGGGTFILREKAKEGYEKMVAEEDDHKDGPDAKSDKPKTLEEKIAERLKEKAAQRNEKKQEKKVIGVVADVPPTPEDWWKGAAVKEKGAFLMAFFAEQTDYVKTVSLRRRDCSHCYGKGILEFYGTADPNQQQEEVPCPRCKTLGFDRIVVVK